MGRAPGSDAFQYSGGQPANDPAWRVVIAIGPSRQARGWIVAVAAASTLATLAANLDPFLQAAVVLALVCAQVRALRLDACREGPGAIVRIAVDLAERVEARLHDGAVVARRLRDGCFVAPWLTIVRWRPDGARFTRTILVAPDAVDAEAYRRLRILLRWR